MCHQNRILPFVMLFIMLLPFVKSSTAQQYKIKNHTIVFKEPKREKGQQSMLQFAADPIPVVRIGFIGLGMRGPDAVNRMTYIDGVEVVALCDLLPERVERVQTDLQKKGLPRAASYTGEEGWKELCNATTSTWFTSAPIGCVMCLWRCMRCNMESTWPLRCRQQPPSKSAGN